MIDGSQFMTVFNQFYYSFSPTAAQSVAENEILRAVTKLMLYPLIGILHLAAITYDAFPFSVELGVDVHKAAAYAFAVKVTDCDLFTFLRSVRADDGDGIPSVGLSVGSGPTALHQALCLMRDELHAEACWEATPKFKVWAGGFEPLQNHILQANV